MPTRSDIRVTAMLPCLALLLVCLLCPADSRAQEQALSDSKEVAKLVKQGNKLLDQGKTSAAIQKFTSANEAADGRSFAALMGLAQAHRLLGQLKEAAGNANDALEIAPSPATRAEASTFVGNCYLAASQNLHPGTPAGSKLDPEQRRQAVDQLRARAKAYFEQAVAISPDTALDIRYLLALVEDDPAARLRLLREYRDLAPRGQYMTEAKSQINFSECISAKGLSPSEVEGKVVSPVKVLGPVPQYVPEARKAGLRGVNIVRLVIGEDGGVACTALLKGLGMGLDEATLQTLAQWEFEPATLDGRPVAVYYVVTTNFQSQ